MLLCAVTFRRIISTCDERDRSSLLIFKQGVVDPSNRLSSWSSTHQDCCEWEEVFCDATDTIIGLVPKNWNQNGSESLKGEINLSSLLALEFLEDLELSFNDFERITTRSINTSAVDAHTHLPANFSKLSFLDLSYNVHLHIDDLHWLSLFPSLTNLHLSGIHLLKVTNWVQLLASKHLEGLWLQDCNLTSLILSVENANFSSILDLSLGRNDFRNGLPNWLFNLSNNLLYLDLGYCNLRGPIPDFSGYRKIEMLDLSNNKLKGPIPDWLGQLHHLDRLNLSNNLLYGSIPYSLMGNNSSNLSELDISFNNLSGTLPKSLERTPLITPSLALCLLCYVTLLLTKMV
ncbi:receptor-like protein 12 [Prosopis cineraria]|uniref:receptor-like protein 12 n=1 Tax=Prosopis cineraria TaxID=364024 RepID=UPI00240FD635|nr:receptor-like protein 12 [Prosopis cineraria]